jgi:hypothetical protein
MTPRRSFLARIGAAAAALGLGSAPAAAQEAAAAPRPAPADGRWQPAREAKDDWLDAIPGKHRMFFDVVSTQGAREVNAFTGNYYEGNRTAYGIEAADLAVVICLRHGATPLAFNDAFWAKYGAILGESMKLTDPKTNAAPIVNLYKAQYEAHAKRGGHFAVCDSASHRFAGAIARKLEHSSMEAVYNEMVANVLPNAHFVPAGIIAVNRAQERGYSIAYVG